VPQRMHVHRLGQAVAVHEGPEHRGGAVGPVGTPVRLPPATYQTLTAPLTAR
jgi:hypothetical protein